MLTFQVLPQMLSVSLWWKANDQNVSFRLTLYHGQFTLSTHLIKPNYLVVLPQMQHQSFFQNKCTRFNTYIVWFTKNDCESMFGVQQAREKLIWKQSLQNEHYFPYEMDFGIPRNKRCEIPRSSKFIAKRTWNS